MTEKAALRRWLRERLRALSPTDKDVASADLCQQLRQEPAWPTCRRVFGFVPLPSEPDYLAALLPHQSLFVPKTQADGLAFYQLFGADCAETGIDKKPRTWPQGVPSSSCGAGEAARAVRCWEPEEKGPQTWPAADAIILVPGLGFTNAGERLGRGGGYYDLFLAQALTTTSTMAWGVAFSCQIVPSLPTESHDHGVTKVLAGQVSGR